MILEISRAEVISHCIVSKADAQRRANNSHMLNRCSHSTSTCTYMFWNNVSINHKMTCKSKESIPQSLHAAICRSITAAGRTMAQIHNLNTAKASKTEVLSQNDIANFAGRGDIVSKADAQMRVVLYWCFNVTNGTNYKHIHFSWIDWQVTHK